MVKPEPYSFLNQTLVEFLLEKGASLKEEEPVHSQQKHADFRRKLNLLVQQKLLTQTEVDTLILGVKAMPLDKLMMIAALQTEASGLNQDMSLHFSVAVAPKSPIRRALEWTLLDVDQLGLPGVKPWSVYIKDFWGSGNMHRVGLGLPMRGLYHQCYWCGRLDFDNPYPDSTVKKTQKYCHAPTCIERNNSNPSEHVDCCMGQFSLLRRRYKERFRYQGRGTTDAQHQQHVINNFKIYCEERFAENLTKAIDPMTELTYKMYHAAQSMRPVLESPSFVEFTESLQSWQSEMQAIISPLNELFQR